MDLIGALLLLFVLAAVFFMVAIGIAILKLVFGILGWIFGPINPFKK